MGAVSSTAQPPKPIKYITKVYIYGDVKAVMPKTNPLIKHDTTFVLGTELADCTDAQVVVYVPFQNTDVSTLREWVEMVDYTNHRLRIDLIVATDKLSVEMQEFCKSSAIYETDDIWRDAMILLERAGLLVEDEVKSVTVAAGTA